MPYATHANLLPKSPREAVYAWTNDAFFREAFGATFIDSDTFIGAAEIGRFQAELFAWEKREYFGDVTIKAGLGGGIRRSMRDRSNPMRCTGRPADYPNIPQKYGGPRT